MLHLRFGLPRHHAALTRHERPAARAQTLLLLKYLNGKKIPARRKASERTTRSDAWVEMLRRLTGTRQLLALSKILHKRKQTDMAMQEFRNKVEGDQRDLEKLLKQKEDDMYVLHLSI